MFNMIYIPTWDIAISGSAVLLRPGHCAVRSGAAWGRGGFCKTGKQGLTNYFTALLGQNFKLNLWTLVKSNMYRLNYCLIK